uniref:Neutral protease 2 n=1 Tax=Onygena corvina TaxID=180788 RepID=A0A0B4VM31_9EURO|nr:neutral protease 2 [Onygena corvina]
MQVIVALAALSSLAAPVVGYIIPRGVPASDSMLDVKLTATGNTMVKATITNNGDRALNLLRFHTIMDSNPTRKVSIYQKDAEVQFVGMMPRYKATDLQPSYFMSLPPKGSVEHSFDIAATHDLSRGGEYILKANGVVPIAAEHSTNITGAANYHSNELRMNIDGQKAAAVEKAFGLVKRSGKLTKINKRTTIDESSCGNQDELTALTNALSTSAQLASSAAQAVNSNQDKYLEYFKDAQYAGTVQSRLESVANECSSTTGGGTTYHCSDTMNGCEQGVLAYTLPSRNEMFNCPIYYSDLPPLSQTCHAQDQATTTLHEMTHNPAVQQPFCEDNGYGYERATALSAEQAVQNADSYALFANAIYVGC